MGFPGRLFPPGRAGEGFLGGLAGGLGFGKSGSWEMGKSGILAGSGVAGWEAGKWENLGFGEVLGRSGEVWLGGWEMTRFWENLAGRLDFGGWEAGSEVAGRMAGASVIFAKITQNRLNRRPLRFPNNFWKNSPA